jgi:hypothetical protein
MFPREINVTMPDRVLTVSCSRTSWCVWHRGGDGCRSRSRTAPQWRGRPLSLATDQPSPTATVRRRVSVGCHAPYDGGPRRHRLPARVVIAASDQHATSSRGKRAAGSCSRSPAATASVTDRSCDEPFQRIVTGHLVFLTALLVQPHPGQGRRTGDAEQRSPDVR